MAINEKSFYFVLKHLKSLGNVISLLKAAAQIKEGTLKGKNFAITFDDGYRDNFSIASKILSRLKLPATFFIPIRAIDDQDIFWWDYIYFAVNKDRAGVEMWIKELKIHKDLDYNLNNETFSRQLVQLFNALPNKQRVSLIEKIQKEFGQYNGPRMLMNWDEISQLSLSGFEVGSHTVSHIPLTDLSDDGAMIEISKSKELLTQRIGTKISGFCYPRGAYSDRHTQMVKNAHYSYAVSTEFGTNSNMSGLFNLRRRNISDYPDFRNKFASGLILFELSGMLDRLLIKRR